MKKIKKESLKLEKEVIAKLSEESLAKMMGGATVPGTGSFGSECACPTRAGAYTCNNCEVVEGPSKKQPCNPVLLTVKHTCASNVGCSVIQISDNCYPRLSDNPPCPGIGHM